MNTVFFFPYAGASANVYLNYKKILSNDNTRVVLYEYPGHGSRYSDPKMYSVEEIASDFISRYLSPIDSKYCLIGHSYGTNVILAICHKLQERNYNFPKYVYLSSGIPIRDNPIDASEDGIRKLLIEQNMTDNKIMENKDLFNFFYPIIANDVENLNNYNPIRIKLPIEARLFKGNLEEIDMEKEWKDFFNIVSFKELEGDHSHILSNETVKIISNNIMIDFI